jgi:hypothetical protein
MTMTIERLTWTTHAEDRLLQRGLTRERVERAVQDLHPIREDNEGEAEWRVDAGGFVVVYAHPDNEDTATARIVSVWPKRHGRRRHLRGLS